MVRGAPLASASLNYAAVSNVCKHAFSASFAQKKTPAAENKEPSQEFDWRPEANAELLQFAVAILKALAGTTRAGIVTADMRSRAPEPRRAERWHPQGAIRRPLDLPVQPAELLRAAGSEHA